MLGFARDARSDASRMENSLLAPLKSPERAEPTAKRRIIKIPMINPPWRFAHRRVKRGSAQRGLSLSRTKRKIDANIKVKIIGRSSQASFETKITVIRLKVVAALLDESAARLKRKKKATRREADFKRTGPAKPNVRYME